MATGSGKTLVATRSAEELRAGRVLVLVPSLDLLAQSEAAWREEGRTGPMIGVSSRGVRKRPSRIPRTRVSWLSGCGRSTRSPSSPRTPPSGSARSSVRTPQAFRGGR
ncbi:DEAD/DEAH box helicase family protein [Streptomyces griseoflavus]|uniref:DEAD/DEAH box helicase family protein n=1 Tax=Streptomyces griseoflavus TaxID=35619 RepID=UPI003F4D4E52